MSKKNSIGNIILPVILDKFLYFVIPEMEISAEMLHYQGSISIIYTVLRLLFTNAYPETNHKYCRRILFSYYRLFQFNYRSSNLSIWRVFLYVQ